MLRHQELITEVRDACASDPQLDAALMYGSIAQGIGDAYSDIEFWLFFVNGQVPDGPAWCRRIGPTLAVTMNEFGSHVVFFEGLIRGEFHFATVADLDAVADWPSLGAAVDDMIVVDRRGALRDVLSRLPDELPVPTTPAEVDELCLRFANWLVLALHVNRRGEVLRAQDALAHARRHLIWMARLDSEATETWLTPSRRAERELPPSVVKRLHETLVADPTEAVRASWREAREIWQRLSLRVGVAEPQALWSAIDEQVAQLSRSV